jgi:hypothetical protein
MNNTSALSGVQGLFASNAATEAQKVFQDRITCNNWPVTECADSNVWRLFLFWCGTFGLLISQTLVLATAAYRYYDFTRKKNEYKFYAKQSHSEMNEVGDGDESHNESRVQVDHSISVEHSIVDHSIVDHASIEADLTHRSESERQIAPPMFAPGHEPDEGQV